MFPDSRSYSLQLLPEICPMIDSLHTQAEQLARLAYAIRSGLEQAEATVPAINASLASLAALGVIDHQLDGPTIYCRPRGFSGDQTDEIVIYRAGLILPPGLGATVWSSDDHAEFIGRPCPRLICFSNSFGRYGNDPKTLDTKMYGRICSRECLPAGSTIPPQGSQLR